MAKFNQADCDASKITRQKTEDGSWIIKVVNANGVYLEFPDPVSAPDASLATSKTNAHAYLIANCECDSGSVDLSTSPEVL